jgi:ABC-type branched-subunit amino acid transport system substrate-binding protein
VVAVLVTLLAAACTVSDGHATSAPRCDTPGYSAKEIRLGFVYPDTGVAATALGAARSGFTARIGEANAAGGIDGRKIVPVWKDDASNDSQNLTVVRDLVGNDNVFGLVEATINTGGGADYLRAHTVPMTGIPTTAPFWTNPAYRNMFAYSYLLTDGPSVSTFGDYARAQGGTRAALIQSSVAAGGNGTGEKIASSLASVGIPAVPGQFVYNPKTTNPVQLGEQIRATGANVIILPFGGTDMVSIVQGIKAAHVPARVILSTTGYDRSLLQKYGALLTGVTTAINYVPIELGTSAEKAYLNAMANYAPELQPPDQEIALVTYILTDLFLYGLEKAGDCPTRASYVNALRASTYDGGGLLPGPVDLTKDYGEVTRCYTFMKVNAAGTGYDIVPDRLGTAGNDGSWCGVRLTAGG